MLVDQLRGLFVWTAQHKADNLRVDLKQGEERHFRLQSRKFSSMHQTKLGKTVHSASATDGSANGGSA